MKIIKTFNEFISEGVADKYAEREFHIPDNTSFSMDNSDNEELPEGYVKGSNHMGQRFSTPIYKNPKSLNNFEPEVRAIADINGDLYVAKEDNPHPHGEINNVLKLTDNLYEDPNFLLLNRIGDSNSFGFSSSGYSRINKKIDEIVIAILKNTKKKNPNYDFYTEYVGHITAGIGGWFNTDKKPISV